MGNMFRNYENLPTSYIPCNANPEPLTHLPVKLPLEEYNAKDEFIGYSWKYNDTILLEFMTAGEVLYHDPDIAEDAETYLDGKKFLIEFFNFRYELIYSEEVVADYDLLYYLPDALRKLLIPNTYSIQVTLIDETNSTQQVMIDRNDLKIFVR